MQCPACASALHELQVSDVKVDACRDGCGGIWFDRMELRRVDERHEPLGDALTGLGDGRSVDHEARRRCPSCEAGHVMMQRVFAAGLAFQIDECPGCGGMWLDRGELAQVRAAGGESARQAAGREAYKQLFLKQVQEAKVVSENEGQSSGRLARLLFFVCPSWWVKGDQDWGAF